MGFYAIPDRALTERWVERTPDDFVFDVKAHALMTGHATDVARLPRVIRDEIPADLGPRVYAKDLPIEIQDDVWRLFSDAMAPLHAVWKAWSHTSPIRPVGAPEQRDARHAGPCSSSSWEICRCRRSSATRAGWRRGFASGSGRSCENRA